MVQGWPAQSHSSFLFLGLGSLCPDAEVLTLPSWSRMFSWFSLNYVFSDPLCFTSKPDLSSSPKPSWSPKKPVFVPLVFLFLQGRESRISKLLNPHTSYTYTYAGPMGLETPSVFCFTGSHFWLPLVHSSSFFFFSPAFLWPCVGYFSLVSLLLFIFCIGQLTKCLTLYKSAHLSRFFPREDIFV